MTTELPGEYSHLVPQEEDTDEHKEKLQQILEREEEDKEC